MNEPAFSETTPNVFYEAGDYAVRDSVGYQLHQLLLAMRRDIGQRMAEYDLTAAQWYPLWKLKLGAGCTAQGLAREMDVDAGSMTRLLDRLEVKGLIGRARSSTDRRVVDLTLTPAGEAVVEHIPQALAAVNNQYLRGFTHDEWLQLRQLLTRMLANGCPMPAESARRASPEQASAQRP